MSSTINATTVGVGGVVTTADNSGILVLQTASTNAITISAAQGVTLAGTLGVTGATTLSNTLAVTGVTTVAAGTALLPALTTTGDTNTGVWFPAADTIAYSTAGTERMRILSTGLVGIGTSTPARLLSIEYPYAKTDTATRGITVYKSNDAFYFNELSISATGAATQASRVWSFQTAENSISNAGVIALQPSGGNVGIGTTSPGAKLSFGTDSDTNGYDVGKIRLYDNGSTIIYGFGVSSTQLNYRAGQSSDQHVWYAGTTERMRINGSGQVTVNTTTATGNFTVASTSTTSVPIATKSPASFTTATYWSDSATAAGTGWYHFYATSSSATVQNCIIFGNGNVQNTNNSYGAISDIKLKENIVDATPKLEQLNQVRVVNFNLKSSPEQKQLGVIAQELESIFPGMVDEINDRDADNNVLETKTKSVKYSVFVPMLIKAMQEQQAIIETLTARITALETI